VTDFSTPDPYTQPPWGVAVPPRPGVVYAAAIVTWIGATATAALTLFLTVGVLWIAAPIFDDFDSGSGNPRWWVVEAGAVVVALSAAADVAALFVLRGHRGARWALIALSVIAALGGLVAAYSGVSLLVTGLAVTVVVLLLLPDAHAFFADQTRDLVDESAAGLPVASDGA